MQRMRKPENFEVNVTNNMFGDILTDLGAAFQDEPSASDLPSRLWCARPPKGRDYKLFRTIPRSSSAPTASRGFQT